MLYLVTAVRKFDIRLRTKEPNKLRHVESYGNSFFDTICRSSLQASPADKGTHTHAVKAKALHNRS